MNLKILCKQAVEFHQKGNLAEAESRCLQILAINPNNFIAHHVLGVIEHQRGKNADALASIGTALKINPMAVEARFHYGLVQKELGRHGEALETFEIALRIKPDYVLALNYRGAILRELGRFEEALQDFDQAVAIRANSAELMNSRGSILQSLNRIEDALASYDKALAIRPDFAEAWSNRGSALRHLKRFDDALACYDRALAINPNYAGALYNRSLCALLMGDFDKGLRLYEWRKELPPFRRRNYSQPEWTGEEDINGKSLFVYCEQGLGDTIQFCRYAALAQTRGAAVIVSAQDSLTRLLKGLIPAVEIISSNAMPPNFDYHISLLSMPLAFKTDLNSIPATAPYLRAEPERVEKWADKIGDYGFRIGISWQGSSGTVADIGRSFHVEEFEKLAKTPNVRLISLQKNAGTEQLQDLPTTMTVESLGEDFDKGPDAFVDTAAVMEHLNLIITSDTAIAHLAGALNRPTWVATKYVPEWRWLLDRSDSPWYPTMRLFRQASRGDWDDVFTEMAAQVAALIESK